MATAERQARLTVRGSEYGEGLGAHECREPIAGKGKEIDSFQSIPKVSQSLLDVELLVL